jgi:hypothetical protein
MKRNGLDRVIFILLNILINTIIGVAILFCIVSFKFAEQFFTSFALSFVLSFLLSALLTLPLLLRGWYQSPKNVVEGSKIRKYADIVLIVLAIIIFLFAAEQKLFR